MIKRILVFSFLLFCFAAETLCAQNIELKRDEMRINFIVAKHYIAPNYMNNAQQLDNIIKWIDDIQKDSLVDIVGVEFCGSVSPEGSVRFNHFLSLARLSVLEKYVRKRISIPEDIIVRNDHYIAWGGLEDMVENSDIKNKEEILSIIRSENRSTGEQLDSRIGDLKNLDGGITWRLLFNRYFKNLRSAAVVLVTKKSDAALLMEKKASEVWVSDKLTRSIDMPALSSPSPVLSILPEVAPQKRYIYIKTNIVGLALLSANLGFEIDMGNHFSFNLPIYYCALDYFKSTLKFRNFSVQPELRYWPKSNYKGLFMGAHLGFAYYNFAFDGHTRYQDKDGKTPTLGGGLSLGYRLPLGQNQRWNMEFALGAGVYPLHYDLFHNVDNGKLYDTRKKTRIGLDNALIGISYRIPYKTVKR